MPNDPGYAATRKEEYFPVDTFCSMGGGLRRRHKYIDTANTFRGGDTVAARDPEELDHIRRGREGAIAERNTRHGW